MGGMCGSVLVIRAPGVYRPQRDTWLLVRALRLAPVPPGARVLDVCSGTGVLALAAAREGAGSVTAVDISRRAVLTARANAALHRVPLRVLRGDLLEPVAGESFDVIVANPPYVAWRSRARVRPSRAWCGGADGRLVLDRLCAAAPRCLSPGGILLVVHPAWCGVGRTLGLLRGAGMKAAVVDRCLEPFGPIMRALAPVLCDRGLIDAGQRTEELVVIHAARPLRP